MYLNGFHKLIYLTKYVISLNIGKKFEPQLWKISNINAINMVGRTNNALERYNKRIGENFAKICLNLPSFIPTIRTEFMYHSERSTEIRQNFRGILYQSELFQKIEIGPCYLSRKKNQT
ncbi:hypothetical protein MXB_518 [Myxobolus squamalis]|nr:hypothetical protein MXB_518 [Myxobolus squamalis]